MTPRNADSDELDILDRNPSPSPDWEPAMPERPRSEPEVAKEVDRDHDGLPDGPAGYRVPS